MSEQDGAKGTEGDSEQLPASSADVRETVVDASIRYLESMPRAPGAHEDYAATDSVIAEVRRLREENARLKAERDEQDMLRGLAAKAAERWEQQWTEMRDTMWKPAMDKLSRVEALLKSWRSCLDHCNADTLDRLAPARELEAALKG